ncbi:MAG: hypothetical protein HY296_03995 [Thaumarchaeota archaeon]|nr:hypothetical protein [Nitrososphaerota archaeon]
MRALDTVDFDSPSLPAMSTAEYTVRFLEPTPMAGAWRLTTWPSREEGDKVWVDGKLEAGGRVTATMKGLFAAVKENHPAFHRWQ